jgi:hypothetical protein
MSQIEIGLEKGAAVVTSRTKTLARVVSPSGEHKRYYQGKLKSELLTRQKHLSKPIFLTRSFIF